MQAVLVAGYTTTQKCHFFSRSGQNQSEVTGLSGTGKYRDGIPTKGSHQSSTNQAQHSLKIVDVTNAVTIPLSLRQTSHHF